MTDTYDQYEHVSKPTRDSLLHLHDVTDTPEFEVVLHGTYVVNDTHETVHDLIRRISGTSSSDTGAEVEHEIIEGWR